MPHLGKILRVLTVMDWITGEEAVFLFTEYLTLITK